MIILKSTHNRIVRELEAKITSLKKENNSQYQKGYYAGETYQKGIFNKTKEEIARRRKLESKKKTQEYRRNYYLSKVKGKAGKGNYYRVENGVKISNVTNLPLAQRGGYKRVVKLPIQ